MLKAENRKEETALVAVEEEKSFASGYHFYKLFWVFMLGCFFGYIYEVALEFVKTGILVGRAGVIYGPFNPVYGFAAVLIIIVLGRLKDFKLVFVFGSLLGGAFEYFCSFIQEKMFGSLSWDYSQHFLNIDGRTTIPFALFWGILCVVLLKWIIPYFSKWIEKIPNKVGVPLTWLLFAFMVFNMSISSLASNRNLERYKGIPADSTLDHFLDQEYPDEIMRKAFPNFNFVEKK